MFRVLGIYNFGLKANMKKAFESALVYCASYFYTILWMHPQGNNLDLEDVAKYQFFIHMPYKSIYKCVIYWPRYFPHCTEVRFASFLSGGFTTNSGLELGI
jgi:hypothetical protein